MEQDLFDLEPEDGRDLLEREERCQKAIKAVTKAIVMRLVICGLLIWIVFRTAMDVLVDLGGRPYLVWKISHPEQHIRDFNVQLLEEFMRAFCTNARMNLHVVQLYGAEVHHAYEAVFKGLARALRCAVAFDPRETGVPSSKGTL